MLLNSQVTTTSWSAVGELRKLVVIVFQEQKKRRLGYFCTVTTFLVLLQHFQANQNIVPRLSQTCFRATEACGSARGNLRVTCTA
jgi:hypothetical protein